MDIYTYTDIHTYIHTYTHTHTHTHTHTYIYIKYTTANYLLRGNTWLRRKEVILLCAEEKVDRLGEIFICLFPF